MLLGAVTQGGVWQDMKTERERAGKHSKNMKEREKEKSSFHKRYTAETVRQ